MREFTRVFNSKTILLLLILCFVNTGIFILCADPDKEITLMNEELDAYLESYPVFLEKTIKNSGIMSKLGMYQSGFARDNLVKVAGSYLNLEGIQVKAGDNRGVVLLIQYRLTDLFLIIFLFSIVMTFFKERKKGLVYVIRSTKYGREVLFLQRLVILAVAAVLGTVVLYGFCFLGSHFTFGVEGMERSIQSLPEFMKCPAPITIGEYILYSCVQKTAGGLLTGVLLYIVLDTFSSLAAYLISGTLVLLEILTAIFITPVSALNVLRYVNIYTLIQTDSYFTDCVYLNFFGRAVPAQKMSFAVAGLVLTVLAIAGFIVHGRMYVTNKKSLERMLEQIGKIIEHFSVQHSLIGWEVHKLCIRQGALFILLGMVCIQVSLSFQYDYFYPVDMYERLSYLKYYGELTEKNLSSAEQEMNDLKNLEKRIREAMESMESLDKSEYWQASLALSENLSKQEGLQPVLENMREGAAYTKRTGNSIWVIAPYTYDLLINRDQQTKNRASFLALMVIISSMAGIYAYEKQNHMDLIIQTSYRGRWLNGIGKLLVVSVCCGVAGITMHAVQFVHVGLTMGFNDLRVPVQSLRFMREFPICISVGGYFVILFVLRALLAAVYGIFIAAISKICADKFTAMGQGIFLCMFGISLAELIPVLDFISPIYLLCADFFR